MFFKKIEILSALPNVKGLEIRRTQISNQPLLVAKPMLFSLFQFHLASNHVASPDFHPSSRPLNTHSYQFESIPLF